MKQKAAKMDLSIKIVTSVVFIMMLGFFIASIYINGLIIAALIMLMILIFCYLYAPTAYEISDKKLIVYRNYGKIEFNHITAVLSKKSAIHNKVMGKRRGVCRYWHILEQALWSIQNVYNTCKTIRIRGSGNRAANNSNLTRKPQNLYRILENRMTPQPTPDPVTIYL